MALLCGGVVLSGCNDNSSSASNDNNVKPEVKAPWDFDLYLVGEFSGWDRTDKFKLLFKDGVYRLDNLKMNSGMSPFKVGGPEWTKYPDFSADSRKETSIFPDQLYPMYYQNNGQNNRLVVTEKGLLDIQVKVTNADLAAPVIEFSMVRDEPNYGESLYLKGIDGNLEPVLQMVYQGDKRYVVVAKLAPGEHKIKMASAQDGIGFGPSGAISLNESVRMQRCDSSCQLASLSVSQAGYYKFVLDASQDEQAPWLRVSAATDEDLGMINPHEGHELIEKLEYQTHKAGVKEVATFSVKQAGADYRGYAQSTTQELRDPGDSFTTYQEQADLPRLRSGDMVFDALFALATHEMRQNSVAQVKDGSYGGGQAIPCDCFETGAKWHYVWTRDLSYATDLGLGVLDPQRARNSLQFKLSDFRAELKQGLDGLIPQGRQIIQDTGTGGSWPISTDRMGWALAAEQVLAALPAGERSAFLPEAFEGLRNTIESDRLAAFDEGDGLYVGEQSFLDWRDQTYAKWITADIAHIGMSKSLSTNVLHYQGLGLAARLATELGQDELATRYSQWAGALKQAINHGFWLADEKMYASLINTSTDPSPAYKFDLLGESLAILAGIADEGQAREIVSRYPMGPYGAPVYFPQQPDMPVYHNRAIWPFVSAYGLKAAARVQNVAVADRHVDSLMRGAALNLSNMENLEWLSGQPSLMDLTHPDLTGPVINSQRQLWSVGGYLGMVTSTLFGYNLEEQGIRVSPFVTAHLHKLMGAKPEAALRGLNYRGKQIEIKLLLPEAGEEGSYYPVRGILLNGAPVAELITEEMLAASNLIEVQLGAGVADEQGIRLIEDVAPLDVENRKVFAPTEPTLLGVTEQGGKLVVALQDSVNQGALSYNIYRDGKLVAAGLDAARDWVDELAPQPGMAYCYSAEAIYPESGNRSHHAKPVCYQPERQRIAVDADAVSHSGILTAADTAIPVPYLKDWGRPEDTLLVRGVTLDGKRAIRLQYSNAQHAINLGVTNGVKRVSVLSNGKVVASGVVQMPHVMQDGDLKPLRDSTPVIAEVPAGQYDILVSDFYNMSYLKANATYNDAGGQGGSVNLIDLASITVSAR
ncbi:amylo-alpha-1,6-glucosidase [Aeromonas encheleia]|uniref:Amylo-alpha-1,6-glucosidase n=1 Tax=Aeromonas encheleia TaxID=73010 RepID=A0AAE9MK63_9GAMM|nr:amylo-alpha-1,6-glucosidase [Aeromonas encheleia]USV59305.1 amylo-alpha-1,6-glucosidase [Aeromonas encheleia]